MKINCLKNGPYLLDDGSVLQSRAPRPAGEVALCRCGGSENKPFCDGSHARIGFSDRNTADRSRDRGWPMPARRSRSSTTARSAPTPGYCTDGLKKVFRMDAEPWIDPDGAALDRDRRDDREMPLGRAELRERRRRGAAPPRPAMVTVMNDGPYAVTGGVELAGVQLGEGASSEHYTLCRCGGSKNKPFCDGTHWHIGFKDP